MQWKLLSMVTDNIFICFMWSKIWNRYLRIIINQMTYNIFRDHIKRYPFCVGTFFIFWWLGLKMTFITNKIVSAIKKCFYDKKNDPKSSFGLRIICSPTEFFIHIFPHTQIHSRSEILLRGYLGLWENFLFLFLIEFLWQIFEAL